MFKEVVFFIWGIFFFVMSEHASSQPGGLHMHRSGDYGKVLQRFKSGNGLNSLSKLKEKFTAKGKEDKGVRKGKEERPSTVPTTDQSSTPPETPQPTTESTTDQSSTAPTKTPRLVPGFYEVPAVLAGRKRNIFSSLLTKFSSSNKNENSVRRPGDYHFAFRREGRSMNLKNNPDAKLGNKRGKACNKGKKRKERKPEENGSYQGKKLPGDYDDFFILGGNETDNPHAHKNDAVKPDIKKRLLNFQLSKNLLKPLSGGRQVGKPFVAGNYIDAGSVGGKRAMRPPNKSQAKRNKNDEPYRSYYDDE